MRTDKIKLNPLLRLIRAKSIRIIFGLLLIAGLYLFLTSPTMLLYRIHKKGKLIVAIRNAPTIYYEGREGQKGFEYEMLKEFAEYLGVELELDVKTGLTNLLDAVNAGFCDLGSGAISRTADREEKYFFGPDYYTVQQVVIYKRGNPQPRNISDLAKGTLEVVSNSSYEELLKNLKKTYPELSWRRTENISTDQLMYKVWTGEIDFTIADDNIAALNRRYFPELQIGFSISQKQALAWVLAKKNRKLYPLIESWLNQYRESGKLKDLEIKYYSFVDIFDYVDIRKFHDRIETRLPIYKDYFITAGERFGLPWTLLAAQAYQESHWRKRAKSPTGVRGIMMLTLDTAKNVGVTSRLDPEQSIMGGAKYLSRLLRNVPDDLYESDRIPYALAAYNIGTGHMQDARKLAEDLGYNPNSWADLGKVLPYLCQEKYYSGLKHGYARGTEPVRYVSQIFDYWDILENTITHFDR